MKKVIKLTEQDLMRIVKRVINEQISGHEVGPWISKKDCLEHVGFTKKEIGGPMTKRNVWEKTVDNVTYQIPEYNGEPVTGLTIIDRKKTGYRQSCKSWSCDKESLIGITYTDCVDVKIKYY